MSHSASPLPSEGWASLDAALDALLALSSTERLGAVQRVTGGDAALAAALMPLLAKLDEPDPLLDQPAAKAIISGAVADDVTSPTLAAGTRLGAWRVLALIGRGGMGEVYGAERADDEFEQQAAIKLMRADVAPHLARFQAERQIVARLAHPGIARLLDGGVSAAGRPFMVMELVRGQNITEWCHDHRASLAQRLNLFVEICEAVAYAHRNLVVHRDLKPANVMVTEEGRVKLLDFGVARLLDAPGTAVTRELLLTPAYASPEQLSGGAITTAADVYALGLLLHEMLTGEPAQPIAHLPLAAAMQQVATRDPLPPSRAAQAQATPPVPAKRLAGDLDAIVAMALRKEPERRYGSVAELQSDVLRHLGAAPVMARRGTLSYRLSRFVARYRLPVAAGILTCLALLLGTGVALWQARRAQQQEQRALAVQDFLLGLFRANADSHPDPARARATTARELLDIGAAQTREGLERSPEVKDLLLQTLAELYVDVGLDPEAAALAEERVALRAKTYGPNDLRVADALIQQAYATDPTAGTRRSAQLLERARRIVEQAPLGDPPLTLRILLAQASEARYTDVSASLGFVEEANTLIARIGATESQRRNTLYLEGLDLGFLGACTQGLTKLEDARRITQALSPLPPQWVITDDTAIAGVALCLGDFARAEAALDEAMSTSLRVNGPEHIDTYHVLLRQMRVYRETSRAADAQAIQARLRLLLQDPVVRNSANLHSTMLGAAALHAWDTGRLDEADAWTAASVQAQQRSNGSSVPLARALQLRARVLDALGRKGEATQAIEAAMATMKRALGAQARAAGLAPIRLDQAALALSAGQPAVALSMLDALAAGLSPADPEARPLLPHLAQGRAAALRESGRAADAAVAALGGLKQLDATFKPTALPHLRAALWLERGLALRALDQPGEALDALTTALSLRRANDDKTSVWRARVERAVADLEKQRSHRR